MRIHEKCQNFTISGLKTDEIVLTVTLKINMSWLYHSLDQGLIKYYVTSYSDNIMLFHFVSDAKIIDCIIPIMHTVQPINKDDDFGFKLLNPSFQAAFIHIKMEVEQKEPVNRKSSLLY